MRDWQPIATAPKDGTEIDVWVEDRRYPVADCHRCTDARWKDHNWQSYDPHYGGFGAWVGIDNGVNVLVTHWMPLPAPPITSNKLGSENG